MLTLLIFTLLCLLTNSEFYCGKYSFDDPRVCCGHGECISQNYCECDFHWFGPNCCDDLLSHFDNEEIHELMCWGHGQCVSGGKCLCEKGWSGSRCEIEKTSCRIHTKEIVDCPDFMTFRCLQKPCVRTYTVCEGRKKFRGKDSICCDIGEIEYCTQTIFN